MSSCASGFAGVRVLVDVHVARVGRQAPRLADRAVGPLERIGEDELGAEGARDALSLERDAVGHGEEKTVAAHRADERERDAGVPARRVEHHAVLGDAPLLLGCDDHPETGTVLHAAPGVRRLELRPQLAAQSRADAPELQERRAADALEDRPAHPIAHEISREH